MLEDKNLAFDFYYKDTYFKLIDLLFRACGSDNSDYILEQLSEIYSIIYSRNIGDKKKMTLEVKEN